MSVGGGTKGVTITKAISCGASYTAQEALGKQKAACKKNHVTSNPAGKLMYVTNPGSNGRTVHLVRLTTGDMYTHSVKVSIAI